MFDAGEFRFKAYNKQCVLRMSPFIRTNEKEEQSAFAMLLLYIPWPKEGEENLLRGSDTAVQAFHEMKCNNQLPRHVLAQISCTEKSEELLNNIGAVVYTNTNGDEEVENKEDSEEGTEPDETMSDTNAVVVDDETGEVTGSMEICHDTEENIPVMESSESVHDAQVIPQHMYNYYSRYIDNQKATYMNKYVEENSSTDTSMHARNSSNDDETYKGKIPLPREQERAAALQQRVERLTVDQRTAYEAIKNHIMNGSDFEKEPILQFITGGAGVGKSEVLSCIIEMTRLHFGKCPGLYGSVLIMGPTGAAAHHVNGFTWQSVLLKGKKDTTKKNQSKFLSQQKAETLYEHIKGVKLIVLDEISMIAAESFEEISTRFCEAICTSILDAKERAKVKSKPFAGRPTIFCGDLYQLGCVGGTPIYYTTQLTTNALKGQRIWHQIKLYNNLTISTRFRQPTSTDTSVSITSAATTTNTTAPPSTNTSNSSSTDTTTFSPLETFLRGARTGRPHSRYIDYLNANQLCINYTDAYNKCNPKAIWLTSTNKEKDPINQFMYERLKEQGNYTMDVVALHTRNNCPNEHLTRKEKETYYAISTEKTAPVVLHLAIGTRVKIKENLGTQIGEYYYAIVLVS